MSDGGSTGPRTCGPIPPSDPDFKDLYRRRSDAESINRALDDTLWLRRAHSVGHARPHPNMLTFALAVNSLAPHRHRRSSDPPHAHSRLKRARSL
jgi:hypothetical protein